MNIEGAKKLLLEKLKKMSNDEYPLTWVGELMKETPEEYYIEGNIHNDEMEPNEGALPFAINKTTGYVRMVGYQPH